MKGQRVMADPFGWFGAFFECTWNRALSSIVVLMSASRAGTSLYLMLWPKNGIIAKEDVRRMFDGSLFYEIAEERKIPKSKKTKF